MTVASTVYISASTNRYHQAAAASSASLIAFGSSNLIGLWDIANADERGITETLPGHEGIVTSVRFISESSFVSADDRGFLVLWRCLGSEWKTTVSLRAHGLAISSLCVLDQWVVTSSSDASVKIWKIEERDGGSDEMTEEQVLRLRHGYPLALALSYLPRSKAMILAIGGTNRSIDIWVRSALFFVHASVLSGHEDWVKALDFLPPESDGQPLILASGSQDATIRLWIIEPRSQDTATIQAHSSDHLSDELLDAFEASLGDVGGAEEGGRQISLKRHILTVKNDQGKSRQFSIIFDALLIGHEAGINSLAWKPMPAEMSEGRVPTLLSTSTDSSLILWSSSSPAGNSQDSSASIWINRQRFGDIGGQRLGGFIGGTWAMGGKDALAWGWNGGWRRWTNAGEDRWIELGAIGGHSGPIKGLDWSPNGKYLISSGLDQTTRIHAAIPSSDSSCTTWHELSRPQVHGYDLLDAAFISPLRFVSIADEKVIRLFDAPLGFLKLAETLGVAEFGETSHHRPSAASVPPLGLSNKAIAEEHAQTALTEILRRRPLEGELASVTLWPEIEKVFGHGYESMSLTVSPKKHFFATACKATSAEHAVVRVYDTGSYGLVGKPLTGHTLTVTRIAFSPDEKYVLSVSRDRSWRLYVIQNDGFVPLATDRSHSRIIWDCAWSAEGDIFATASRDKTVKLWMQNSNHDWVEAETIKVPSPTTAIAFAAGDRHHKRRLAVGLENGGILVFSNSIDVTKGWRLLLSLSSRLAHVAQVHRLAWQPDPGIPNLLATCSEDGILKILDLHIVMEDKGS